jgi:hypothetical protein
MNRKEVSPWVSHESWLANPERMSLSLHNALCPTHYLALYCFSLSSRTAHSTWCSTVATCTVTTSLLTTTQACSPFGKGWASH